MSGAERWQVGCLGPWAPAVQEIMRSAAPGVLELQFSDDDDPGRQTLINRSDFLFVHSPLSGAMLSGASRLRLIQKWGIGVDKIDLAAAERLGIPVTITAGANASPVAEHAVMLMLAVLRRLSLADRGLREGRWLHSEIRPQSLQLRHKTVGIVGLGNIGKMVARKLRGFETETLYYDPVRPTPDLERELAVRFEPYDDLLARSDIVTLHCPGGAENRHLLNAAAIAGMKPAAVLINAARGELVDDAALLDALRSGRIAGAGLDVFEPEPLAADSPYLQFDNVVLTPHTAASVMDNVANVARHAFANMMRVVHGEPLPQADLVVMPKVPRYPAAASAA